MSFPEQGPLGPYGEGFDFHPEDRGPGAAGPAPPVDPAGILVVAAMKGAGGLWRAVAWLLRRALWVPLFGGRLFPSAAHLLAWGGMTFAAVYTVAHVMQRRRDRLLLIAEERWRAIGEDGQKYVQSEVVSSQWFNLLLKTVWPTFLEQELSGALGAALQKSLDRAVDRLPAVLRSAGLQGMELEEFALGVTPPKFGAVTALYDAETNYLRLETTVSFVSSGMQALLRPVLGGVAGRIQSLLGRIEVSQLSVRGTMMVGLALSAAHPGVRSAEVSFKGMPLLDLRLTPHGAPVSDLPALFSPLKDLLQDKLATELVEPRRVRIDLPQIFEEKRGQKRGGAGGLLAVAVVSGSGFPSSRGGDGSLVPAEEGAASGPGGRQVRTFVEVSYTEAGEGEAPGEAAQAFRTPVAAASSYPQWGREFDVALDAPLGSGAHRLRVRVRDMMSGAEPEILGEETVDLDTQGLVAGGARLHVWVPLAGLAAVDAKAGVLLQLKWVAPAKGGSQRRRRGQGAAGTPDGTPGPGSLAPGRAILDAYAPSPSGAGSVAGSHSRGSSMTPLPLDLSGRSEILPATHSPGLTLSPPPREAAPSAGAAAGARSPLAAGAGPGEQVASLVRQVQSLEDALTVAHHKRKHEVSELSREVAKLQRRVANFERRKLLQEVRALTEGAPFLIHSWNRLGQVSCSLLHLWLAPRSDILMYGKEGLRKKKPRGKAGVSGKADAIMAQEITNVVLGSELFPRRDTGIMTLLGLGSVGRDRLDEHCFSICLSNDTTLNVEVPPEGNGRSREEWVSALRSLMSGRVGALFHASTPEHSMSPAPKQIDLVRASS